MTRWLVALAPLALLCLIPSRGAACSCVASTFEGAREAAAAIFEGVVTRVEDIPGGKRASLRVVRVWKGDEDVEQVEVRTGRDSASCGVHFEPGEGYLVYASDERGWLFASLCGRTRRSEQADEDFAALGVGVTPVDVEEAPGASSPPQDPADAPPPPATTQTKKGGFASCSATAANRTAAAPGALGGGALLLLAWRRRAAHHAPARP